ncbi:YoaK family protein [Streptomyces chiangmaiensis]|uniref:YoaK family protein n=1 Tax=Streptomyces chiangmaiensis TaxID=766497 RepID=A0ABU7FQ40_9ACTN|nr:YoaK family protein [Streptomyces chiangmaiensis]MED7825862.1 YoaK family protein [Streptomyces chiangmaiensis]
MPDPTPPRTPASAGESESGSIEQALPTSYSVRLGVLLAVVGGALDAYTFVSRDGVFANAQTGNIVLLGVEAAKRQWWQALQHVPPILAFLVGVVVAESLRRPRVVAVVRRPARGALVLEILVLIGVGFIPAAAPDSLVTVTIAFVASVQVSSFRTLVDTAYNTTMTTGNLRTVMQSAYLAAVERDGAAARRARRFAAVICGFLLGAVGGAWLTGVLGTHAVWVMSVVLVMGLALFLHDERVLARRAVGPGRRGHG